MRFLIIYLACLFLLGCNSGGFSVGSELETQKVLDMDLMASEDFDGAEDVEAALNVAEGDPDKPAGVMLAQNESQKPRNREFGKRSQRAEKPQRAERPQRAEKPRGSQRSFGKRKSDSDLVAKAEEVSKPEKVEGVVEIQDINNKVDVLVVVDGSFSTRDVLRSMPERMDGFIPALSESLDWRAAFLSAHVKNNQNKELSPMEIDGAIVVERKYITQGTRSNESIFIDSLTRNSGQKRCAFPPQCGGFKETPLLALTEYILSPTRSVNNGTRFIRDDAHLAVVIVTDNKENKRKGHIVTADEVVDTIRQEFGDEKEFSVHTLTTMNDACRSQLKRDHFFAEGNRAAEMLLLTEETGGASLSLCSHDYAVPLAEAIEKSVLGEEVDCSACENSGDAVAISDHQEDENV
ncbi:MAG: hypothetical protein OXK80_05275 [Bdellovibrionales bacterium]|nr:hypothetical protein [Bdellovibrionales bacterium]